MKVIKGKLFYPNSRPCGYRVKYLGKWVPSVNVIYYLEYGKWPLGSIRYHDGDCTNTLPHNLFDYCPGVVNHKASKITIWDSLNLIELKDKYFSHDSIASLAKYFKVSESAIKSQVSKRRYKREK